MFNLNRSILRQALDLSPAATIIVDARKPVVEVVYANQAFEALSGYEAAELLGLRWEQLLTPGQTNELTGERLAEIQRHQRLGVSESLRLSMAPLYDQPGNPRFWMGIVQSATVSDVVADDNEHDALTAVLRAARVHLRQFDGRDSATGVLNRRAFDDIVNRDWGMARRDQRALTLILFRLDCLNEYREVFGRHAADACLQKVAHAITGSLRRASDLVARFADDQFSVLVMQNDEAKVREFSAGIAAKVRSLAIHHPRSNVDRFVTISYGVATAVPGKPDSINVLIEKASLALQNPTVDDRSFGIL